MNITFETAIETAQLNTPKTKARQKKQLKIQLQQTLKQLAEEVPATSKSQLFGLSEHFRSDLASELNTTIQITIDQFDYLLACTRRDCINHKDANGFVDDQVINQSPAGRLLKTIINMYVMSFGVSFASKLLNRANHRMNPDDAAERAQGIGVLLINPEPTQKGARQSVCQLAIQKSFSAKQLTNGIKLLVRREIDRYFDKVTRGTTANQNLQCQLVDDPTAEKEETKTGRMTWAVDTARDAEELLWRDHVQEVFNDALESLTQEQKLVLSCYFSDEGQEILSTTRKLFVEQVVAIKMLTGLSVRKSREVAKSIIKDLQTTLGISAIDVATAIDTTGAICRDDRLVHKVVIPAQDWTHDDYQGGFRVGSKVFTYKHVETLKEVMFSC